MKKSLQTSRLEKVKSAVNKHFLNKIAIPILFLLYLTAISIPALGQQPLLNLSIQDKTVKEAIKEIEKQTGYSIMYDSNELNVNRKVTILLKDEKVAAAIDRLLAGQNLSYSIVNRQITIFRKADPKEKQQQGEQKKVTGTIRSAAGVPLPGVSVQVKNSRAGTTSDANGAFILPNVPEDGVLQLSFVGMKRLEVAVQGRKVLNITMEQESEVIDEVVVTALGIKRQKRSLGYSTSAVRGEELTQARDINLGNALTGKVSGVMVAGNATGVGGSSRVVIRGNASLTGNNQPLYIIDGIPFDNKSLSSAGTWGDIDMGDGLSNFNPDDIAEFQVLKGAAASALYGYRGGNGVVLITTKSGQKGKPVSLEFNNNLIVNTIYDYRDFQTIYGQGTNGLRPTNAETAKASEVLSWGERMDGGKAVNFLGNEYKYSYVDNWDKFYRTGVTNTSSLALSGASQNITYRFGISNMYDRGILPNSSINQQGINMNTTYDISSKLHLMVNANYVFEKFNGRSNLSDGNGNTNAALLYHANSFDIEWMKRGSPNANWGTTADGKELISGTNVYFNNPYWLQYRKTNKTNKNRLTGGMTLKYDFTDYLYAQATVTRDGYVLDFQQVQPIGAAADPRGFIVEYSKNAWELNAGYLIGFDKKFGSWSVTANIGGNMQRNVMKQWKADSVRPFLIDGLYSVNNTGIRPFNKYYSEFQVNSIYGSADIGFKNQVFLNLTARNDWFSTLNPKNNSYLYPSVGMSWVFSDTFKFPNWFTFGKLRASYAAASNGTDPYMNLLFYKLLNYTFNGQNVASVKNGVNPNSNLKPVRISEWEVGLNVAFLNNRISLDAAYYRKITRDDIARVSISDASGFGADIMNVGRIENSGFEFLLGAVPVRNLSFSWSTSLNFGYNNNVVKYLGGASNLSIDGASSRLGNVTVRNIVGQSYGMLVGYKYMRTDDGRIVYKDGIPQRSAELQNLGSGVPKVTGGWKNDFVYKGFNLSLLVDYKFGGYIFSGTNYGLVNSGLHKKTAEGRGPDGKGKIVGEGVMLDVDGKYVKNNVAVLPETYWQGIASNNIAEEFVYDASFIKLREVALGYTFPKALFGSSGAIKGITLSLVGRNLWTILKYTDNIDPESAYNNSNGQGLELNGYPAIRSLGFNLNVKF